MSQTALSKNETLFFCFGPPKSGTTFLQRTLNIHPDISCPPEHQFNLLIQDLEKLIRSYHSALEAIDIRTGGQGVIMPEETTFKSIVRFTIESMIKDAARNGETCLGANDNNIRKNIKLFDDIFKHPKMIYIIRNPIDMAISAWHHNIRLSKEESDPTHIQYMEKYGGFDDWVRQYSQWFALDVQTYIEFSKQKDNITLIRYEDLVSNKQETISKMLEFLDARINEEILIKMVEQSDLLSMRKQSTKPGFFRAASTDMGKDVISMELRNDIEIIAGNALKFLEYDLRI